jgi:lysophospholipase L1-like esterase
MRADEWDVTISTNALGLRGPPVEARAAGARVLLLGDSFVEGYTVRGDQTVAAGLQRLLRAEGDAGAEVLNGGTAGYSTDQEVLFYERDGRPLRPDVVVLFFYVNDLWYNTRDGYWRGAKPWFERTDSGLALRGVPVPRLAWASRETSEWLTERSALYRQIRALAAAPPPSVLATDRAGEGAPPPTAPGEFQAWRLGEAPELDGAWALTEALLVRLRDGVAADGGAFVVFHVPSKAAVYDEVWSGTARAYGLDDASWSATADAERLRGICARHELDCLLPLDRFRAEGSSVGESDAPYFPIDGHWTAVGHELAATVLHEWLAGRGGPPYH